MIYLLISLSVFLIDYNIKKYMDSHRLQGTQEEYLDGKIIIRNCHNSSGMLGIFKGREALGTSLAGSTLICVVWELLKKMGKGGTSLCKLGLALILGGGSSNYYDRITRGYVTDYISFGVKNKKAGNVVYNLSDFFIFAGAILYLTGSFMKVFRKKK